MKVLNNHSNLFVISVTLTTVFTLLFFGPKVSRVDAATKCIRSGNPAASDVAINPDKIREEDRIKKTCSGTGVFAEVLCALEKLFAELSSPANKPGKLSLKDSEMPSYLRLANELTLSGDIEKRDEPGGITGGIAKILIPNYEQDGLDPIQELEESEGQLVTGKITLNNRNLQKNFTDKVYDEKSLSAGKGYYDLQIATDTGAVSNYQVEGRFGEIAPLYDRFGFLKQLLMPSASEVEINDDDCSKYDPSLIAVTEFEGASPNREVPWTAYQYVGNTDEAKEETRTCDVSEVDGKLVETCPDDAGNFEYEVGGNLDVQTEVSLASEAWERIGAASNIAGEGGVFNVLLPPDTSFRTDEAKPNLDFSYDTHSDLTNYSDSSVLNIADLGNVEGATNCIVNQLTAQPSSAAYGTCENAFGYFAGVPIECTGEATPLSFPNSLSGTFSIARRAWDIVNNLYQGFWCYWNWSKVDYPNVFNESLYLSNPYPSRSEVENCSECLFWCTRLVWVTHPNHGPSLNSQNMKNYYESGGRFVSASEATPSNIKPGYVVFFQTFGGPNRLNHVGIVYSVTKDSITFIQANAATKSDTITFNSNGVGVMNLSWATVGGFGKP